MAARGDPIVPLLMSGRARLTAPCLWVYAALVVLGAGVVYFWITE